MKSYIFWDITPCLLKINRRFGENCRLHLQGRRINQRRNKRECRLTLNGLRGVISQKTEVLEPDTLCNDITSEREHFISATTL